MVKIVKLALRPMTNLISCDQDLTMQSMVKQLIGIMLWQFRFQLCFTWLQNVVDKLLKKANVSLVVGTSSWREQFIEAITVSAGMSSKSSLHPYSKNNQMPLSWYAVIIQNPEWQIKLLVVAGVVLQPLFGLEKLHIDPLYHFVYLSDNCCLLVCKQKAHQDNILFTPTHLPRTAP